MITFTGGIYYAVPNKSSYKVGEGITLQVYGEAVMRRAWYDYIATLEWDTGWYISDPSGKLLGYAYGWHSLSPTTVVDSGIDKFSIFIGYAVESMNLTVELWGKIGFDEVKIDSLVVPITVAVPVPPIPTPVPTPTPTPKPKPETTDLTPYIIAGAAVGLIGIILVTRKK